MKIRAGGSINWIKWNIMKHNAALVDSDNE